MNTACPANEQLKQLLDGELSAADQTAIQSHLESCDSCQRTLESLVAGKESWSGVARQLAETKVAREAALDDLIKQAKQSSNSEAMLDEPDSSGTVVLDFLQPAEQPGILGRLKHYDVIEVVGRGGMGVVLKAFDSSLRRIVAIKVLSRHLAAYPSARRRFVREAQAAAAVAHEHVVAIHAVEDQNEPPYLVMQFIAGKTLQDRLDHSGPPQVREILRIGLQTAAGLAAAHAQGLVHRDIKPANILLENGIERVKLTDFGLARAVDDASVTQSGVIAGTPQYMSPEQARGDIVDHRSDLFSLGSVLYAMCVGHAPFRATTTMGVLKRLCEESARPIREVNPEIPEWLCDIINKLHAKKPADRFQSAREVAALLGEHLAHLQQPTVVAMPARVEMGGPTSPNDVVVPNAAQPRAREVQCEPAIFSPQVQATVNQPATRLIPTVHPMLVTIFWSGWAILVVLGVISALARFNLLPQSAAFLANREIMFLVSIGLMSLVMLVIVQAIVNRNWRATSLGPRPVLAAMSAAAVLFVAIVLGLDIKMHGITDFFTKQTRGTAELSFALAGPQVEVTLNGERLAVNDRGLVTMHLQPGEYEVIRFQNGLTVERSGELMHSGQKKFVEDSKTTEIKITGPLSLVYGPGSLGPNVADVQAIQGRWVIVSQEKGGERVHEQQRGKWIEFDKDLMRSDVPETPRYQAFLAVSRIAIDPTTEPKHFDVLVLGAKGIYRLERDQLTLCIADAGQARPTEFISRPDSLVTLTVCRREMQSQNATTRVPPVSDTIKKELRELISQSEQDVINTRQLYAAGQTPMFEVNRAEQALLAVKIRLTTAEGRTEDLPRLHDELVKLYESTVAIAELHFEKGVMSQSDLSKLRKELTEARVQREIARQQFATP